MESISQVGKQLREKRKQAEDALRTEFQESLMRLEQSLTQSSSDKLTTIASDTDQRLQEIAQDTSEKLIKIGKLHSMELNKIKDRNEKYLKAILKLHKQSIETEGEKWRKLLTILLPTALICGLMLGVFATLYLSHPDPDPIKVKESEIAVGNDGTKYLPIGKIPNLIIEKE